MHVHFEESKSRGDCTIQALSWMGRVPDMGTEGESWQTGDEHAEEGWLASGNIKGTLGITLTATHGSKRRSDSPTRANFNLRGHRSAITMVEWNEPYQKLATCDFSGVIFVWIKHEGRWSIELINDRNIQVTDFAWSHSGRMALIIYRDGFVLVGSVAGQRFWSSMLNVDNAFITCGIWTPDDQKVMFGTSQGHVVVMSATGVMLSQVSILEGSEVTSLAWSCERFTMDALEDVYLDDITVQPQFVDHTCRENTCTHREPLRTYMLAAAFKCGKVYLMSGHDDVCPRVVDTGLIGVQMAWSSEGLILAVGGYHRQPNLSCESELRFYTTDGNLLLATIILKMSKPLMSLTWGHNDRRLFLGVGCHVVTAWVHKVMPSLEFLCRIQTHTCIQVEEAASHLPLPPNPGCHQEPYVALFKHTPSASRQSNYRSHVECDTTSDMLNSNGSHQTLVKTANSSSSSNSGYSSAGHCQGLVNSCTNGVKTLSVKHAAGSACQSSSLHSRDMQDSIDTAKPSIYQCVLNPRHMENMNLPSSIINTIKYIDDEEDVGVYNQAFQMSGEDLASLCKPTCYVDQCKQTNGADIDSKDLIKPCLIQQDSNGANSDSVLHDDAQIRGKHILCANRPKSLTGSLEDMLILTQHEDDRFQGSSTMSTVELKASSGLTKAIDSMHINKSDGILSGKKTDADPVKSCSLPSSPLHKLLSPKHKKKKEKKETTVSKSKISSPLKQRRLRKYNTVDSSDDEVALNNDDHLTCENYKDLESFQKAQLKQKLRRARSKPERPTEQRESLPPRRRYLIMHNKAPLWNEASQVYQLDFGGRVTQESAKNFQIELQGKQVMQFGRIDSNAYTLDFQQPFCAVQAFAVALANVTQRLK